MINKSEQWLLEGNCSICRKQKYCNKNCNARKKALEQLVKDTLTNKLFGGK